MPRVLCPATILDHFANQLSCYGISLVIAKVWPKVIGRRSFRCVLIPLARNQAPKVLGSDWKNQVRLTARFGSDAPVNLQPAASIPALQLSTFWDHVQLITLSAKGSYDKAGSSLDQSESLLAMDGLRSGQNGSCPGMDRRPVPWSHFLYLCKARTPPT